MRTRISRAPRRSSALLAAGLLCLTMSFGASTAFGGSGQDDGGHGHGHGHGNGNGNGNGNGGGGGNGLAPNQCATFMLWLTSVRPPLNISPYAAYDYVRASAQTQRPLRNVAFVISQDFPYSNYMSWFIYAETFHLPTDVLSNRNITPDPGSVNPNTPGTPIFAPNRHYQILVTAESVTRLPENLASIPNRMTWKDDNPQPRIFQRSYNELEGYDRGGTGGPTDTAWPDIRTYNVKNGKPIDCAPLQVAPDLIQQISPWNDDAYTGTASSLPAPLRPLLPQRAGGNTLWPPKPNPRLLEFFRAPGNSTGLPGAVANPPDTCANYLMGKLDQREIALFRVPRVPTFQPHDPEPDATYVETDTQAYNFTILGNVRETFRPNSAFNYSLGNDDIKTDQYGGATFVVWPRSLNAVERRAVIAKARANGWNLLQGSIDGAAYADEIWLRQQGQSNSFPYGTYSVPGVRNGVPCMNGPQSTLDPFGLTQVPAGTNFPQLGPEWADVPAWMGTATPQGVQCDTAEYLGQGCVSRLKQHIAETGGDTTGL
jgi:hypothetical protein